MDRILISEQFPQQGKIWSDNPYALATEICRWANHLHLTPEDILSVSIFPEPLIAEHAVGAVVFYWS